MEQQPPTDAGSGTVPDAVPGASFGVPGVGIDAVPNCGSGTAPDAVPGAALGVAGVGIGAAQHCGSGTVPDAVSGAALGAAIGSVPDDGSGWGLLLRAVDAVAGEPTWRHSEDDLADRLREYEAVRARLDAHRLALIRELDARGWAAAVGATSTQAWLAQALRVDPRAAAADVRAARALDPAADAPPEPGCRC